LTDAINERHAPDDLVPISYPIECANSVRTFFKNGQIRCGTGKCSNEWTRILASYSESSFPPKLSLGSAFKDIDSILETIS